MKLQVTELDNLFAGLLNVCTAKKPTAVVTLGYTFHADISHSLHGDKRTKQKNGEIVFEVVLLVSMLTQSSGLMSEVLFLFFQLFSLRYSSHYHGLFFCSMPYKACFIYLRKILYALV